MKSCAWSSTLSARLFNTVGQLVLIHHLHFLHSNAVFGITFRSLRSRCIIARSDDLHKVTHTNTRTNAKHKQLRRSWRSNFSPLTWCSTGPCSGKRRAARGAPQTLHTQEEEERQKCIIKKPFEWRLNIGLCTTVIRSMSSACLKSSPFFWATRLYYHHLAMLQWRKLEKKKKKKKQNKTGFAFYRLQVENKNNNKNKSKGMFQCRFTQRGMEQTVCMKS